MRPLATPGLCLGVFLPLLALVALASAQSSDEPSTYIEPEFPPSGALYFTEEEYWKPTYAALALLVMIIGAWVGFFGYRLFKLTLACVSFISCSVILVLVLITVDPLVYWFNTLLAILLAIPYALIAFRFPIVGVLNLGFVAGLTVGTTVWVIFGQAWDDNGTWWVGIELLFGLLGALPFAFASAVRVREGVIISSSVFGSYLVVAGLDYYFGEGWAVALINMFQWKTTNLFPIWVSVIAVLIWALVSVGAVACQHKVTAAGFDHRGELKRPRHDLGDSGMLLEDY